MLIVEVAKANPMYNVKPAYESFTIQSPKNSSYCEGLVQLKFTVNTNAPSDMHNNYCYKIDEMKPVLVSNITVVKGTLVTKDFNPYSRSGEGIYNPNPPYYIPYNDYVLEGNVVLPPLPGGWHNLTVNRGTAISDPKIQSLTVRFFVNVTLSISVTSPKNETYETKDVPVEFTTNFEDLSLSYSLDNQAKVTATGNITLTALTSGSHSLAIYGNDTAGNVGKSEPVFFAVNTQPSPSLAETTMEPSPTLQNIQVSDFTSTIIVSAITGTAIALGVIVYVTKRKGQL
jgi:hypothetical protein